MVAGPWPGVRAAWPRTLDVPSTAGASAPGSVHRWHVLDNAAELAARGVAPAGTLLCVHGNPTWSYLWRDLIAAASDAERPWRVVAVDQLDMGFSERTGAFRRLGDRITDLGDLTDALGLEGPVVTVGHDWGGAVSLGWALRHRGSLAGVVLTNTAVHPAGFGLPPALRLALHPAVHGWGTTSTAAFLRVTHALARPRLADDVRAAYLAPYATAARRAGVGNFVADIPAAPGHPSWPALEEVAEGIRGLDVPALLLWGPKDPVFSDRYLRDLIDRLPGADVHRFEGAGHLLAEDRDIAGPVLDWLGDALAEPAAARIPSTESAPGTARPEGATTGAEAKQTEGTAPRTTGADAAYRPLGAELDARRGDVSPAVVDMLDTGTRNLSWSELAERVDALAAGLDSIGVRRGDRVSLLVPPGIELTTLIYACLRLGAVIVVADAGLGTAGLGRAVAGAGPGYLIGIDRALVGARLLGWPGERIAAAELGAARRRALGVRHTVPGLLDAGRSLRAPETPHDPDADAAVLFTSGSTGPAKGVVYTHRRLAAMRDAVRETYGLLPGSALVAGFAPFALLGPALGATSVTPAMDATSPKTLTAAALADAAAAIDAGVVFASPAALASVLATAAGLDEPARAALGRVSLLLSAGAPLSEPLLARVQALVPAARLHTPYGMTEALPVADIDLAGIRAAAGSDAAGAGNGVCVGRPVPGARVAVAPLDAGGAATGRPSTRPGVSGEILVSAPHLMDRYDRLWITGRHAASLPGWHRTGDVGHLDAEGRLWVEGRLAHTLTTSGGVRTPVASEQAVETVPGTGRAAVVGVGPAGAQLPVVVLETVPRARRAAPAQAALAAGVRAAVAASTGVAVAAVLVVPELPTDVRHNSKIDRAALSGWAERVLGGGRFDARFRVHSPNRDPRS
ncbi:alpha/beta fold hydrolase [Arthrobacter halodurans]|uniref:Alpha/beta fold hydrolase n=1 Tax=Arthrobacter halodurans TaxID=516699 RepID=A0ABV4UI10_9MICC